MNWNDPPCLTAALDYLKRGWSAIALCSHDHEGFPQAHQKHCPSPGKAPWQSWKLYQDQLPKASALQLAWKKRPNSNVGVCLGPVSGLLGLDIDGDAGEKMLAEFSHGILPDTLEFTTPGGGRRLLYVWPAGLEAVNQQAARDGGELRILGKGRQTVMPPSIHWTGKPYEWREGHSPNYMQAANPPGWLVELLIELAKHTAKHPPQDGQGPVISGPMDAFLLHRVFRYLDACDGAVSGQLGHNQTFKVAVACVKGFGLDLPSALAVLTERYNHRCDPPWSRKELEHKVLEASKVPGPVGYLLNGDKHVNPNESIHGESQTHGATAPAGQLARHIRSVQASAVKAKPIKWLRQNRYPRGGDFLNCGAQNSVQGRTLRTAPVGAGTPDSATPCASTDHRRRAPNCPRRRRPNEKVSRGFAGYLDGETGLGKSTVLCAEIADLTKGPDAVNVGIVNLEDPIAQVTVPRLKAAGADLDRVHIYEIGDNKEEIGHIELPRDIPAIRQWAIDRQLAFLAIDPGISYLEKGIDWTCDQDMRRVMDPLALVAREIDGFIKLVRHWTKGAAPKALTEASGAGTIANASRIGWACIQDPQDPALRYFVMVKSNLCSSARAHVPDRGGRGRGDGRRREPLQSHDHPREVVRRVEQDRGPAPQGGHDDAGAMPADRRALEKRRAASAKGVGIDS